jgi:hypothetical protein
MAKQKLTSDISQVLAFPFKDEKWLSKVAVSSVLIFFSFIPVLPVVLFLGYLAEIIRRIAVDQESPSLPEWDDLNNYFQNGFRLFGAGAVYMLPSTLFMVIGYIGMFVPVVIAELGSLTEIEAMNYLMVGYLAGFGFIGIGVMLSMVTGVILPIAGSHVAVKGEFAAAFRFKEIWQIFKANWSGFLVAFLIIIGGSVVLYYGSYFLIATVILCFLYPFALCGMSAYLGLIGAALFGEAYRDGRERLLSRDK